MKTNPRLILASALLASLAFAAIGHAADTESGPVGVCDTTDNGAVPKPRLMRALNRMVDMGETPKAREMDKDARRKMQFDVFWRELTRDSGG
jgi:hypothetical protein